MEENTEAIYTSERDGICHYMTGSVHLLTVASLPSDDERPSSSDFTSPEEADSPDSQFCDSGTASVVLSCIGSLVEEIEWLKEQLKRKDSDIRFLQLENLTLRSLQPTPCGATQTEYTIHTISDARPGSCSIRVASRLSTSTSFGYVAIGAEGDCFVADWSGGRVLRIRENTHDVFVIAGMESQWDYLAGERRRMQRHKGDAISTPSGMAVSVEGTHILFSDWMEHVVYRMNIRTGKISRIAGTKGLKGYWGDRGHPRNACLNHPSGIAITPAGEIIVADSGNNRLRKINKDWSVISTIAGRGKAGYGGDGGLAIYATLACPTGVAVDGDGNVFFADWGNHRVRRIDASSGIITTVAGCGDGGYDGDGGAATDAKLNYPMGIAVTKEGGHVIIADWENNRVRRVDGMTGVISTIAGTGGKGEYDGGEDPALQAFVMCPQGVAVAADGSILLSAQTRLHFLRPEIK